jgi:hypothetical protein
MKTKKYHLKIFPKENRYISIFLDIPLLNSNGMDVGFDYLK